MPFFDSKVQHVNDSIASLNVEHDSGRVLAFQLGASDTVTSANRFSSQLSVMGKLRVVNGQLQPDALQGSSVAYQSLQVKSGMSFAEVKTRTSPFLRGLLPGVLPDNASIDRFYMGLDQTVSSVTGNGLNDFGDVALDFQVALPATILANWLKQRKGVDLQNASMQMSLALQAKLREIVPANYFQNLDNLGQNFTAAALLVWSCMPIANTLEIDENGVLQFTRKGVFWEIGDPHLRRSMIFDRRTTNSLLSALQIAHDRLLDAGENDKASFFTPDQAGAFQEFAFESTGDILLQSLLGTEQTLVDEAAAALKDLQQALPDLATAPIQAIRRLADFGAKFTTAFNQNLTIYSLPETTRALNSLLMVEASRSLDISSAALQPAAMLSIIVLTKAHTFALSDYLAGKLPPPSDVAVGQALTNLGTGGIPSLNI
jgi:hypothetical protein